MSGSNYTRREIIEAIGLAASFLMLPEWLFAVPKKNYPETILKTPGLVSLWDFSEPGGQDRISRGQCSYALREVNGPVVCSPEGPLSGYSAQLKKGQYFRIKREDCPKLNLSGPQAQVSVVAWVKRARKENERACEAVAGMWNETRKKRQYCLFLNLRIYDSANQVCGHVSNLGGPTRGHKYCMDASIGQTPVPYDKWRCVGMTYDSYLVKSYLNGVLDKRPGHNPYPYPGGLFEGGEDGADFTVGAVHRSGEMGNWFTGLLGGLAVFSRALSGKEMAAISSSG